MIERQIPAPQEALYIERLHHNARGLLGLYYPRFLPHEPIEIRFANLGSFMGASYEGMLRGKHYMFLNRKDDLITDEGEVGMLMHELVHSGHAEHVGVKVFQRLDLDSLVSDEEFEMTPPFKIFNRIDREYKEVTKQVVLSDTVEEGITLFIHLDVLKRELESAQVLGRKKREVALRQAVRERQSALADFSRSRRKQSRFHWQGFQTMMFVFAKFEGDRDALVDFMLSIDLSQTNEIPYGHPDYIAVVANPLLLPMIA